MGGRRWTDKEINYLTESWGATSIPTIASSLGKSITAVELKANRLKLGSFMHCGDYITLPQLWEALGLSRLTYRTPDWLKKHEFPFKYKKVRSANRRFKVVYLDDFWKWAENNKELLDFSKLEYLILGQEPEWVDIKRNQDRLKSSMIITTDWTSYEDTKLLDMLKSYRYTLKDIANYFHRTEQAVKQRICKLNIKYRPIPMDNQIKWTDEDVELLIELVKEYPNYTLIKNKLSNHSEMSIKSKLYRLFGTQVLHRIKDKLAETAVSEYVKK